MGDDCTCSTRTAEPCPVHDRLEVRTASGQVVATNLPEDPPLGWMAEALELARGYAHEQDTRLGLLSRAVVKAAGLEPRRFGLVVDRPTWLEDTDRVQREVYRLAPAGTAYVRDQVLAAVVELIELLQNLPWKSPRDGLPEGETAAGAIARAQEELVDVLIFVGNIAVALGLTDETLWVAVNDKASRNVSKRRGLGKEAQ